MPNWTINTLTMKGIKNKDLFTDYHFDFNKIVKQPDELSKYDSKNTQAILYYLTDRFRYFCIPDYKKYFNDLESIVSDYNTIQKYFIKTNDNINRLYKTGKEQIKFLEKYGYCGWYDWRINNWGVKWNSSETVIINEDTISFETPWGQPTEVIIALSKMFPDEFITLESSDEDDGYDTLYRTVYQNGIVISYDIFENQNEYDGDEEDDDVIQNS